MSRISEFLHSGRGKKFILLFAGLLFIAAVVLVLGISSGAWLYDESSFDADFSIIELDFDLFSNHMRYHYKDDPSFTSGAAFSSMLASLQNTQNRFDGKVIPMSLSEYNQAVKNALNEVYPPAMIAALDALYSDDITNADYNTRAAAIYNEYSAYTYYPFRIKNMAFEDANDDGKSMWYHVAADILNLYAGEYVREEKSTGLSSSTVKIGVKLPGATTYSSSTAAAVNYYDMDFDETVMPLKLRFKNTAQADSFMSMYTDFGQPGASSEGIICMLLPRETAVTSSGIYREQIAELLQGYYGAEGYTDAQTESPVPWSQLNYEQLKVAVEGYSSYAAMTYTGEYRDGEDKNNVYLRQNTAEFIANGTCYMEANMLIWADYEMCMEIYEEENPGKSWALDSGYKLFRYDFKVNMASTFKDIDLKSEVISQQSGQSKAEEKLEGKERAYLSSDDSGTIMLAGSESTYIGLSNFEAEGNIYFQQEGGARLAAQRFMSGGTIRCDFENSAAANYIGRLRIDVDYKGFSPAYLRVNIIEQWTNSSGQIVGMAQIPFAIEDGWYDNRENDLYLYGTKKFYSVMNDAVTADGTPKKITVPVVTGLEPGAVFEPPASDTSYEGLKLHISVGIQAVQPNRIEEIWGIDKADYHII